MHFLQTPPPLYDFEQWIDIEIKLEDKEWIHKLLQWEADDKEMMEKRRGEEAKKRSTRKKRKGGVLLRTGRRERRSLSVRAERKQR